jgi:hypothetical protein
MEVEFERGPEKIKAEVKRIVEAVGLGAKNS